MSIKINLILLYMRTQELDNHLNSTPEDLVYEDCWYHTTRLGFELIIYTNLGHIKLDSFSLSEELIDECEDFEEVLDIIHDYSFVFKFKIKTLDSTEFMLIDLETKIQELC